MYFWRFLRENTIDLLTGRGGYSDRLGRRGLPEETLEKAISHKLVLGDFIETKRTRIDLLTSRDPTND